MQNFLRSLVARFNSLNSTQKLLIPAGIGVVAVVIVGLVFAFNFVNKPKDISASDEEKSKVFKEIIANTPQSVLENAAEEVKQQEKQQENVQQKPKGDAGGQKQKVEEKVTDNNKGKGASVAQGYGMYQNRKNAYTHTTTTYNYGSAYSTCSFDAYYPSYLLVNRKTESYDYYSTGRYYFRNETKIDNTVIDFGLYKSDSKTNQYVSYNSGQYAVRENYPIVFKDPASYPTSYPDSYPTSYVSSYPTSYPGNMTVEDYIEAMEYYFGKGVYIKEYKTINNQKYIILARNGQITCDVNLETETPEATIKPLITLYYINANTFEVTKYETYLENDSSANLLTSTEINIQDLNVNDAQLSDVFSFKYSTNIKEVYPDYSADYYELYKKAVITELAKEDIQLLVPTDARIKIDYVYMNKTICLTEWCNLYIARAFFPAGELGDKLFNARVNYSTSSLLASPIATINFHGVDLTPYGSASVYANSYSLNKIKNSKTYYYFGQDNVDIVQGETKLNVNNGLQTVKYVDVTSVYPPYPYSYPTSYVSMPISYVVPVSFPTSYPKGGYKCTSGWCFYKTSYLFADLTKNKHSVEFYSERPGHLQELTFKTFETKNSADMNALKGMLGVN